MPSLTPGMARFDHLNAHLDGQMLWIAQEEAGLHSTQDDNELDPLWDDLGGEA